MRRPGAARTVAVAMAAGSAIVLAGCAADEPGNGGHPASNSASETVEEQPDGGSDPVAPGSEQALVQDGPTGDVDFRRGPRHEVARPPSGAGLAPTDVRFGVHRRFDRLVIDLSGAGEPGWTATYVDEPTTASTGQPITLAGGAALELTVEGLAPRTGDGAEPPRGVDTMVPRSGGVITEVARGPVRDGRLQVLVGLEEREPFRVFSLEDPPRVVLDVRHPDVGVRTRDCGDVGFEPNTDAGAFRIEATGVGCRLAREVAGEAEDRRGAAYSVRNFDCRPTGTVGQLPSVRYDCSRGEASVTFDAS